MKRSRKAAGAVAGAATLLAIGVSASAQSASSAAVSAQPAAQAAVTIPSSLTPPPGNKLVKTMTVLSGSQVYTCTAGAWTLLEPVSVLHAGNAFVLNTKGPAWTSVNDGSSVTGATAASVSRPGAAPELLVKAVSNSGTGWLGDVDYIQRLDTVGGALPTGACTDGAIDAVRYQAQYRFWVPDSAPGTAG
jgi:hypothetical protein